MAKKYRVSGTSETESGAVQSSEISEIAPRNKVGRGRFAVASRFEDQSGEQAIEYPRHKLMLRPAFAPLPTHII